MRNQSERDTRHSERASHEREHHSHGRGRRGRLFEAGRMKLLGFISDSAKPQTWLRNH